MEPKTTSETGKFAGNYFKIEAENMKRLPCFNRSTTEVRVNDSKFWLMETLKKVTGRNPEWKDCFGEEHVIRLMTRAKYVDLMKIYKENGNIVSKEGKSTECIQGPAAIGAFNKEAERETSAANRKRKLAEQIQTLAVSTNWLKTKYEMLLEDPEVLHKWSVIKEGACLTRLMTQKERNLEWTKQQKLRKWQAQLLGEMDVHGPDDRSVFWIMDTKGGSGKTWFTKYMYKLDPEGTAWLQNGKTHDLIKIIVDQSVNLKLVMFDLCRSNEERINWDAIERIKNGMIMSTKYEVESTIIDSPAVVCFANFEPDLKKLSVDRWIVYEIKDQCLFSRKVAGPDEDPYLEEPVKCREPIEELLESIGVSYGKSLHSFMESGNLPLCSMYVCWNIVESLWNN